MFERFIAFDVETPNSANNRMSAIGVAVVENGRITEDYYTLVNPETHFDPFNIALTGITPKMAEQAPAFPEVWEQLRPVFESGLLIAHNAPFDMGVLSKCLRGYDLFWSEKARYACTCRMGRKLLPQLPNHKLDTLCAYYDLDLSHHHAGSDSRACAELLMRFLDSGVELRDYVRVYDLLSSRTLCGANRPRRGGWGRN